MEENPKAPVTPEVKSEATLNTETNTQAQADNKAQEKPDMHGFTSDELAEIRRFLDASGGLKAVKSKISNPEPKVKQPAQQEQAQVQTQSQTQTQQFTQAQPVVNTTPRKGTMTENDFLTKMYYDRMSQEKQFAPIAKEIASGAFFEEMDALGIRTRNDDGTLNDEQVRMYMKIKADSVAAKQPASTPEASVAPTVDYVPVGEKIENMNQAREVMRQDASLRANGQAGHPAIEKAREYLKNVLNK